MKLTINNIYKDHNQRKYSLGLKIFLKKYWVESIEALVKSWVNSGVHNQS